MSNIKLFLLMILFPLLSNGQKSKPFFFDECNISINKTILKDENTSDKIGFGIGMYRNFMADKKVNILFGFEFNQSNQLKKNMYEGHYAYSTNVTYSINSLSIPLAARLNVGKKIKFFIEAGGCIDLNISSKKAGVMHSMIPISNNQRENIDIEFNGKANLSGLNYGPSAGIGFRIPFAKHEMIVKMNYKYGMNELADDKDPIYNKYIRIMLGFKL